MRIHKDPIADSHFGHGTPNLRDLPCELVTERRA
jgi:hypothetical protein